MISIGDQTRHELAVDTGNTWWNSGARWWRWRADLSASTGHLIAVQSPVWIGCDRLRVSGSYAQPSPPLLCGRWVECRAVRDEPVPALENALPFDPIFRSRGWCLG